MTGEVREHQVSEKPKTRGEIRAERIAFAKSRSIIEVAEELGMELFRDGQDYRWKEHDSFVLSPKSNLWNWFRDQKGGDVLQLVQEIKEVDFNQAIDYLNDGQFKEAEIQPTVKEEFRYYIGPYEDSSFELGRSYLKRERGLSDETIDFFLQQGVLVQANAKVGDFIEPVLAFKTLDHQGKVTGASLQGLEYHPKRHSRGRIKQIMKNSDGLSGMHVDIGEPKRLIAAEAPIDLMSYYELYQEELQDVRLLAMDGLKEGVVSRHFMELEAKRQGKLYEVNSEKTPTAMGTLAQLGKYFETENDQIHITLAVDNDEGGHHFVTALQSKGIPVTIDLPPILQLGQEKEDWNDYLKAKSSHQGELKHLYRSSEEGWQYQGYFSAELIEEKVKELTTDEVVVFSSSRQLTDEEVKREAQVAREARQDNQETNQLEEVEEKVDNSRLAQARRKLDRLHHEFSEATDAVYSHSALANGQPMNDKRGGTAYFKRQEQLEGKVFGKLDEIKKQKERVERLEQQERFKEEGLNRRGTGLEMSIQNIPRIREELERAEHGEANYAKATIRRYKKELQRLEEIEEKMNSVEIQSGTQALIDEGLVTQWRKNPTIYFVKGLRKVAFELDENGYFQIASKYQPKTQDEKAKVQELLERQGEDVESLPETSPTVSDVSTSIDNKFFTYDEVVAKNKELVEGLNSRLKTGDLSIGFDTDVYLYDVFGKLGNSHPLKYVNEKRLEILSPVEDILRTINDDTVDFYKQKGTAEQDTLYQALKPHQRNLGVQISTGFIGELAISAYNTNKQIESLSSDSFGSYYNERTLDNLSQSIERMLEYPLIEADTRDFNYGFVIIPNIFYRYLEEQSGNITLNRSHLEELMIRIDENPIQVAAEQEKRIHESSQELDHDPNTFPELYVSFEFSENPRISKEYFSGDVIPYRDFIRNLYEEHAQQTIRVKTGVELGYDKTFFSLQDEQGKPLSPNSNFRFDIGSEQHDISYWLTEDFPIPYLELAQKADNDYHVQKFNNQKRLNKEEEDDKKALEAVPEQGVLFENLENISSNQEQSEEVQGKEKKIETKLGDFPEKTQEAAPLPETTQSQPLNDLSPSQTRSQSYLHFTINGRNKSIHKDYYHPISDSDLVKLNRYASNIQQAANWYLDTVADSNIIYFYQEGESVNSLQVRFDRDKFMHLTGVFPYKEGQTAEQTLEDFANGNGAFDTILLANKGAAFDKLKVLPELPAIVESDSFYFDDLSEVPKLHSLDLDKAIKSGDEDIVLALRTVDNTTFPASLMKLRTGLKIQLDQSQEERTILGIYRERDGQIEQLSINEEYVKDGGQEMLSILMNKQYEQIEEVIAEQSPEENSINAELFTQVLDAAYNVGDPRKLGIQTPEESKVAWARYYELFDAQEGNFTAVIEVADQLGLVDKESNFYQEWNQDRIYNQNYHVRIQWFERWSKGPQLPFKEAELVDYQTFAKVLYEENRVFYERNKESVKIVNETGNQDAYIPYTKVKFDVYAPGGKLIEKDIRYDIADEMEPISSRLFSLGRRPLEGQAELAAIDEKVLSQLKLDSTHQEQTVSESSNSKNITRVFSKESDSFDYKKASAQELSEQALKKIRDYAQDPESLKEYLDFMSHFPKLSPRNVALIHAQWKGANAVATFKQWQELGQRIGLTTEDVLVSEHTYTNKKTGQSRTVVRDQLSVKAGETSHIRLFRPVMVEMIPALDKEGNPLLNSKGKPKYKRLKEATLEEKAAIKEGKLYPQLFQDRDASGNLKFTTYNVFELSQTTLKPESYPKAMPNRHYDFNLDQVKTDEVTKGLENYARSLGIVIKMDKDHQLGNSKGAFYPASQEIHLNPTNTAGEKIATTIHKLAHATLHNPKFDQTYKPHEEMTKERKELEAEMSSYLVSKHFGLSTDEKAIRYMAIWTKNLQKLDDEKLNCSMKRVHRTVAQIVKTVEKETRPFEQAPKLQQGQSPKQTPSIKPKMIPKL
ncbi:PBECR4 domain-containing protein [Streptococcus sp. B01]|uniref:PBECR4 domain-containing protein n=1 Tax=Streptococcus sp. B01 TaxID=2928734 RepID=UPI00211AB662|nr:PBECR4 domain-containing protein [Streptococcus sp. B01]MCQ9212394.1 PBECR4 domain-containing protein [Streptococcus sp. B01]